MGKRVRGRVLPRFPPGPSWSNEIPECRLTLRLEEEEEEDLFVFNYTIEGPGIVVQDHVT
jgi:hypothetical protein